MTAMTAATLRPPMPLRQPEQNACLSCVVTQLRWMLGLSDAHGRVGVRETDKLIGRKPGQAIVNCSSIELLLRDGCEVAVYGPRVDMGRLRREGISYFREWKGRDWDAEAEAWWTPERFAAYLAREEEGQRWAQRVKRQYLGRFSEHDMWFTSAQAEGLVKDGWLVSATVNGSDTGTSHAVLLYEAHEYGFSAYVPEMDGDGLWGMPYDWAASSIRRFAEAVRLPR